MYAFHRQLHPPTGLDLCLCCHFMDSKEENLVTAGVNQLHVYRLNDDFEIPAKGQESIDIKAKKAKLECLATYQLFGNIVSLEKVRLAGAVRDSLLLSFRDAKLSMVEYDPGTHDLKTSSMHYFEEDELKDGFCQQLCHLPLVRVDPEGRCAAMLIYGTRLVILPFRRDTTADDKAEGLSAASRPPIMSSYIIDVRKLDEKIINILDFQFLHGYYEPTILMLHEPLPTWSGRVAVRKDSCSIVAISLNIQERVHPIIWSLGALPFDCKQIFPVPKPIGGVLVFAVNSLMYLNQSFPPLGVSLNSLTDFSTDFLLKPQEGVKITLDAARAAFITYDKMVVSLRSGELYVLTLVIDGMRAVRNFLLDKSAASVLTACMCVCSDDYLFLGSRLGNSLLLKYTEKAPDDLIDLGLGAVKPAVEARRDRTDEPPQKKRKDVIGDWMASDVSQIDDLDELEVYGADVQGPGSQIANYTFEVCDSIMNIGPCTQTVMGEPAFLSEEFSSAVDPDLELVTTSGYGKNGAISVLQRSIRPQVVTTFELPGCTDMWTVIGQSLDKKPEEKEVKEAKDITEDAEVQETKESEKVEMQSEETKEDPEDKDETEGKEEKTESESKEDKEGEEEIKEEDNKEPAEEVDLENSHSLLILSREDSTMVLQTGQEIMEIDHSGFTTQAPTVFAGNIGDNQYILQVSPSGVRLMEGVRQVQHIPIDVGSPLVCASVADPHLVVLTQDGQVLTLTLKENTYTGPDPDPNPGPRLVVSKPQLPQSSMLMTLCAYKDVSGMFSTRSLRDEAQTQPAPPTPSVKTADPSSATPVKHRTVDDVDELLYGDSDVKLFASETPVKQEQKPSLSAKTVDIQPTYWVVLVRESGVLELYSLPDFKLRFLVKNFPMGLKVLVDTMQATDLGGKAASASTSSEKQTGLDIPIVKELLLVGLGSRGARPYLMARVDDELLLYEAFPFHASGSGSQQLKIRFRKVPHGLILKDFRLSRARKKEEYPDELDDEITKADRVRKLRPFTDISGYAGVFVCGPYPHWLFMSTRGMLRIHPMSIDGSVVCFTPFHNVNCPKGFLYFNKKGELRISVLPTHLSYDASWPVRKVPLRCTPHHAVYHPESKTYSVVTSVGELCNRVVKVVGDGEKEFETQEKDDRFIYPTIEKFTVQLFSPVSWEPIPNTKMELDDFEYVTCMRHVILKSEGTLSGLKGYVAVGTNFNYNEEVTARGRLLIYDVIEVVPEPGQPLTKNKMKIEYHKEQKGPVTALEHVQGFLVTAMGQKIYIWQLKNEDICGVAFIDTQIFIHSMSTIKNLILVTDIYKSISLLRYQTDMKVLSLVSRDIKPLEVYGVGYLVDNANLCFLVSDRLKNLIVYSYEPEVRESHGGQWLLRKADFNVGSHVNNFFRVRCKLLDPSTGQQATGLVAKRQITYFASLDGSIDFLLPITEKMYRRLSMVQNALNTHIPHLAGLNPKGFRLLQSEFRCLQNTHKNILDGDLLWKYLHLSINERIELAKRIGTTVDQIIDDLMEVDRVTSHF